MRPITIDDWLGPYKDHPGARSATILQQGALIIAAMTLFLTAAEADGVELEENPGTSSLISGSGNGGFRPQDCPVGAPHSAHKDGRALDIFDPRRAIMIWALSDAGRAKAADLELYFEHPQWTRSWLHGQHGAPGSGHRFFVPYSDLVANPPTCGALVGQTAAGLGVFSFKGKA